MWWAAEVLYNPITPVLTPQLRGPNDVEIPNKKNMVSVRGCLMLGGSENILTNG